ncbi:MULTISPECIES: hypothetical protein [Myxococcaceae]|nr:MULTISPECIES: hypothetical protein [Myxococcaceae]MBF5043880.1 hypothetical protein [Simulacricoccus sp. 17bor-14]
MAYLLILWSFFGFGHPQPRPAASTASRTVVAQDDGDGIIKVPCPKCTRW